MNMSENAVAASINIFAACVGFVVQKGSSLYISWTRQDSYALLA